MTEKDVKNEQMKLIVSNISLNIILFLFSSILFYYGYINYSLGLLLGAFVSSLNHYLLFYSSGVILKYGSRTKRNAFLYYLLRYLIFGVGFVICLLLDYFHISCFFWGTYLIPFFTLRVLILFKAKSTN